MHNSDAAENEKFSQISSGRKKATIAGVFWSGINSVFPALAGFIVFTACSRVLSPKEFGVVILAYSFVSFAGAFTFSGFGDAIVQRVDIKRAHLDSTFILCLTGGISVYIVLLFSIPFIASWYLEPALKNLSVFLGLKILFDSVSIVPNALLARSMAFNKIARRTFFSSVISCLACLLLLAAGLGVWAFASSLVVTSAVSAAVAFFSVTWKPKLSFELEAVRILLRVGAFSSLSRLVQLLNIDQILIATILGTTSLGEYGFARRIFQILNDLIAGAIGSVSHALLSSLQLENEKLSRTFHDATFLSTCIAFPIFVGLAVTAGDTIPMLFGQQWASTVPLVQLFCGVGLLASISVLQASLVNSQGRTDLWLYYQLSQIIGGWIVIFMLGERGLFWVILGTLVKTCIIFPLAIYFSMRVLKGTALSYLKQFIAPALSSLGMAGAVIFSNGLLDLPEFSKSIITILIGAVVYSMFLFMLAHRRIRSSFLN